ncbi:hypothetical protein X989_3197 [Burkholderia pseudomallei MSHR4378]|nr:hypothetical protein X989_3197 [Burkholderia pseudomallei MSHR4378]
MSRESQVTSHKSQVTSHKSQVTSHKSQVTSHKSQVASSEARAPQTAKSEKLSRRACRRAPAYSDTSTMTFSARVCAA